MDFSFTEEQQILRDSIFPVSCGRNVAGWACKVCRCQSSMEAVAWTPCPVPSRWRLLAMAAMMVVSSSLFWHLGDAEKYHCPLAMALKPDCTTCGTLAVCA